MPNWYIFGWLVWYRVSRLKLWWSWQPSAWQHSTGDIPSVIMESREFCLLFTKEWEHWVFLHYSVHAWEGCSSVLRTYIALVATKNMRLWNVIIFAFLKETRELVLILILYFLCSIQSCLFYTLQHYLFCFFLNTMVVDWGRWCVMVGRVGGRGKGCVFPKRRSYIILILKLLAILFVIQLVEK